MDKAWFYFTYDPKQDSWRDFVLAIVSDWDEWFNHDV